MDALFDGEDVQEVMRERFYKSDARPPRMRTPMTSTAATTAAR